MKALLFRRLTPERIVSSAVLAAILAAVFVFFHSAAAQEPQLSLADFLIGLRSKKVTLQERNKLLTEAAKARGVTFALTPEIEKELQNTGADKDLIDAIRSKASVVKVSASVPAKTDPVPVSTPPPPDHAFYQKRAGTFLAKGDFDSAVADLSKAIELNSNDASDYNSRGLAYYNKKSYDLAIADYSKSLELKSNESMTYLSRGFAYEKSGDSDKALADFQKAVDLDTNNESASLNLKRLKDDKAAKLAAEREKAAAQKPVEAPKTTPAVSVPDAIALGQLSSAQALKMVMPIYSDVARKANIEGKVTVNVTLDTQGNVVSAKAESGHPFLRQAAEEAAKRSKFKPAMFGETPVKATGFIVYNFTRNGGQ
jgi:TonB family protein